MGIVNTIVRLTMTHNKNLKYDIYNDNGMEIKIVVGSKNMFKVLIAEDEPPIMRMIKSTLESVDSDLKLPNVA